VAVRDGDLLHAELDRQLSEVRAACDGLATRAGLLVAALAAVAAVFAPRIDPHRYQILLVFTVAALGIATLTAIVTLVPWLKPGPERTLLASWMSGGASARTSALLYDAKLLVLGSNLDRWLKMRTYFGVQGIATAIAVALALVYTALR
jgi:hypothetical protein